MKKIWIVTLIIVALIILLFLGSSFIGYYVAVEPASKSVRELLPFLI